MKAQTLIMYVIITPKGKAQLHTLSQGRLLCMNRFLESMLPDWNVYKRAGWRCIKVDVNIQSSK